MPRSDQGVDEKRYHVIPRTLIFVTHENRVLEVMLKREKTSYLLLSEN